ncbi:hypothetical protein QE152_g25567 [Popillia japonica]|uniref:Uncharacterized protein n=1 Tax=Popillia japonica TaxID=7064 RepID=A0AAW1K129_POPJA
MSMIMMGSSDNDELLAHLVVAEEQTRDTAADAVEVATDGGASAADGGSASAADGGGASAAEGTTTRTPRDGGGNGGWRQCFCGGWRRCFCGRGHDDQDAT